MQLGFNLGLKRLNYANKSFKDQIKICQISHYYNIREGLQ
jgi:hypothetical protein